jgi:hypothetical protein
MKRTFYALLISLCLTAVLNSQTRFINEQKLDAFAQAIAHAEGFGVKHTIPTRYHNPGDIRARRGVHYPGQVGLNKHGYVIFKDDGAGFSALKTLLRRMASGQSRFYGTNMTITKVAKRYATGWRLWAKNVSKQLNVPPSTTLRSYFAEEEVEVVPPVIQTVTAEDLRALLDPLLGDRAVSAMIERRKVMKKTIDELVARKGRALVIIPSDR